MTLNSYYQTDRYKSESVIWRKEEFFPKRLENILNVTKLSFKGKVLDVGCGDGGLAVEIQKKFPKVKMYGVDISSDGVKLANRANVKAKVSDLNKKFPFNGNNFDFVISLEVLEHVLETDIFFTEVKRVLKKGGIAIISTPNLLSWYQRVLCVLGITPTVYELSTQTRKVGLGFIGKLTNNSQPVGHIRVFNKQGLEDMAKLYGFKVLTSKSLPIRFGLPRYLDIPFNILDKFFSLIPSLGADLVMVIQKK